MVSIESCNVKRVTCNARNKMRRFARSDAREHGGTIPKIMRKVKNMRRVDFLFEMRYSFCAQ